MTTTVDTSIEVNLPVRTVYNHDWPYQLKFSLHARVTNSMRVTLPKELRRAVEAKRLDQTIVGEQTRAAAPHPRGGRQPGCGGVPRDDAGVHGARDSDGLRRGGGGGGGGYAPAGPPGGGPY